MSFGVIMPILSGIICLFAFIFGQAKNLLFSLGQYFLSEEKVGNLEQALESINKINKIMDRMPEHCDPYIYYNRVRPYIFGWKNNPDLPKGLIYEGFFKNKPQQFRGETGAQSSIIPLLDALFSVKHKKDSLRDYLEEMLLYMPPAHRELIFQTKKHSKIGKLFSGIMLPPIAVLK